LQKGVWVMNEQESPKFMWKTVLGIWLAGALLYLVMDGFAELQSLFEQPNPSQQQASVDAESVAKQPAARDYAASPPQAESPLREQTPALQAIPAPLQRAQPEAAQSANVLAGRQDKPGQDKAAAPPLAPVVEQAPIPPSFDVVRADAGGGLVVAGKAQPNWTVRLKQGKRVLKEETVDETGSWMMMIDKAPEVDDSKLSLSAVPPQGGTPVEGRQVVDAPRMSSTKTQSADARSAEKEAPKPAEAPKSLARAEDPRPDAGKLDASKLEGAKSRQGEAKSSGKSSVSDGARSDAVASTRDNSDETDDDDRTSHKQSYTVARGDSLWRIARKHYGKGSSYTKIYRSNRNQIQNPNLIYPNQRFTLSR
jgi:hypothetical protein